MAPPIAFEVEKGLSRELKGDACTGQKTWKPHPRSKSHGASTSKESIVDTVSAMSISDTTKKYKNIDTNATVAGI